MSNSQVHFFEKPHFLPMHIEMAQVLYLFVYVVGEDAPFDASIPFHKAISEYGCVRCPLASECIAMNHRRCGTSTF